MRRQAIQIAAAAAIAAGCFGGAAHAASANPGDVEWWGLTGQTVPAVLQQAKADPYAPPVGSVCQTLPAEIDALNAALGPDADQAQKKPNRAGKLLGGAIRGLIPHRDVIRFLTSANKKDDAFRQATMAGWARRGYLKGLAKTLDCTSTTLAAADLGQAAAAIETHPLAPSPQAAGAAKVVLVSDPQPEPLEFPPS